MDNLKKILSKVVTGRPDVLQFAKDRKYEESWIIPLSQPKPTEKEIDNYLQRDVFKTIIVEYIWNSQDNDNRFVLTLFLDDKCNLTDPREFMHIALRLFYEYPNFPSFIQRINNEIIGRDYLLNNSVDSINLSVFNHWLSVGPVDLWEKGNEYNFEKIKSKIQARPEIEKTKLNYQGLLFRFNVKGNLNGPYYGIKTPCCNKSGDEWIIDFNKVDRWIRHMLEL